MTSPADIMMSPPYSPPVDLRLVDLGWSTSGQAGHRHGRILAMGSTRPRAVLFDLWGTLVAPRSQHRDAVSRLIAQELKIDPTAFMAAMRSSHAERFLGASGSAAVVG